MDAGHTTRNSSVGDISWTELPGYGRTLSAMTPRPHTDEAFAVGSGPSL